MLSYLECPYYVCLGGAIGGGPGECGIGVAKLSIRRALPTSVLCTHHRPVAGTVFI